MRDAPDHAVTADLAITHNVIVEGSSGGCARIMVERISMAAVG
jgi:hypothetical protein